MSATTFHCRGGLGRAGMISARLLVESGVEPEVAIAKVRAARPGAIETREQELGQDRSTKPIREELPRFSTEERTGLSRGRDCQLYRGKAD